MQAGLRERDWKVTKVCQKVRVARVTVHQPLHIISDMPPQKSPSGWSPLAEDAYDVEATRKKVNDMIDTTACVLFSKSD